MAHIIQLDSHLANMIAAGEVVERPSSVVKELVENSIDASATQITINLLESGTKLIEIIDNGIGMSCEDAKMCFARHATSKIKDEHDLFRIHTLGFRGEAIPSIASISKFSLFTSDGNESTNVNYNAGKLISINPCAMNRGTKICVENLFYNVPARLKYLKSLKSELGSITYIVSKFILANPQISFKLTNDNKLIYQTNGSNDIVEVFGQLYGVEVARNLVSDSFKDMGYTVSFVCAKNMISRSNKLEITTIVNNRYVKSNVINDAICAAYNTLIPEGRYPIALIKIDIDPLLIDVNVHPSKMTIKIANELDISNLITLHLKDKLCVNNLIPDVFEQEKYQKPTLLNDLNEAKDFDKEEIKKDIDYIKEIFKFSEKETSEFNLSDLKQNVYNIKPEITEEYVPTSMRESKERIPSLRYIGQIHGTYLIFESVDSMYIMDQHAAAERINYEYYYNILANPTKEKNQLLVPLNIELTLYEVTRFDELKDELIKLGFDVCKSGENSYFIREIPSWLKLEDVTDFIHSFITDYESNFNLSIIKYRDTISKQIACKASIKANHVISPLEVETLVNNLRKCINPFTCPHGRPTIIKYSKSDLEKMFLRIM